MLHFVPEPGRAVAEMRRVARPGATVAAAVWDVRGGFVANRLFFDTAAALDPAAALRRAKNYTRPMTRPGELASAWRDAGFAAIEAAELAIRMEFASFDDYWAPYAGKDGPAAEYVATLDAAAVARLRAALGSAYLDGEADGARSYVAVAWAVREPSPEARAERSRRGRDAARPGPNSDREAEGRARARIGLVEFKPSVEVRRHGADDARAEAGSAGRSRALPADAVILDGEGQSRRPRPRRAGPCPMRA